MNRDKRVWGDDADQFKYVGNSPLHKSNFLLTLIILQARKIAQPYEPSPIGRFPRRLCGAHDFHRWDPRLREYHVCFVPSMRDVTLTTILLDRSGIGLLYLKWKPSFSSCWGTFISICPRTLRRLTDTKCEWLWFILSIHSDIDSISRIVTRPVIKQPDGKLKNTMPLRVTIV